ncbi:MAG: hypothetical protein MJ239_04805 [Bacilli bacterium]|nr:hypothetical protein [Bacilli bacterium]
MEYKLHNSNGYPLVEIEGKLYLIDTGSYSFSFDGNSSLLINGARFPTIPSKRLSQSEMVASFGAIISGYVGRELLERLGGFEINLDKGVVVFGDVDHQSPFTFPFKDSYMCSVIYNGKPTEAYFDTGAAFAMFLGDEFPYSPSEKIEDWVEQTNYGPMHSEKYKASLSVFGQEFEVESVRITDEFKRRYPSNIHLYFGLSQIAKHRYGIDYKNRIVFFE